MKSSKKGSREVSGTVAQQKLSMNEALCSNLSIYRKNYTNKIEAVVSEKISIIF